MKRLLVTLGVLIASSNQGCSKSEDAPSSAAASASAEAAADVKAHAAASLALPRIGGNVVAAGEHSVEVAVHQAGLIEAVVTNAAGKAVTEGVKLAVTASVAGGTNEKVELAFSAPRARFVGRAKAGAALTSGPLVVSLEAGGKPVEGRLALAAALPQPKLGGHLLTAGAFTSELLLRPSGEVQAFVQTSAGADVEGGAEITATVSAAGGAREDIALAYDAPRASFSGRAKAGIAPGPIQLSIKAGSAVSIGGLERVALSVDAAHGGQMVAVGDFGVELVAKGAEISAFVFDAAGKAHAAGDLDLKLDLGAAAGGALALRWDAPSLSYKGKLGANVDLSAVPVRVLLVADGKLHAGAIASLRSAAKLDAKATADVDAKAKLGTGAALGAKAGASAKLQAPDVKAKLDATAAKAANAGAKVQITPPKVNVSATQSTGAKAGGGAKASAGFSLGTK